MFEYEYQSSTQRDFLCVSYYTNPQLRKWRSRWEFVEGLSEEPEVLCVGMILYFITVFCNFFQPRRIPEPLQKPATEPLVPVLVHTTLIRDQNGLGFSIAGGKGSPAYKTNSEAIFVSRITDGGVASRDGKLCVGDKVVSVSQPI